MDNFKLIYKILALYRDVLWKEGVSPDDVTPKKLNTSEEHIHNVLIVLRNAGLIVGTNGKTIITLAGLDYLENDRNMKKVANAHKPYSF